MAASPKSAPYIRVDGATARVCGTIPASVLRELQEFLLWFDVEDFNDRFRLGKGRVFYFGLAKEVSKWLEEQLGQKVPIRRRRVQPHPDCAHWELQWPSEWKPREFQTHAVEAALAKGSGPIIAPARTGKTVIMAMLATALKLPTLVLTYGIDPKNQFHKLLDDKFEFENAGAPEEGTDFTIMTVAAFNNLDRDAYKDWLDRIELLLVDEAHHAAASGIFEAYTRLPNLKRIHGFTATYRREDDRERLLLAAMGTPVYQMSRTEAIEYAVNVPLTIFVQPVPKKDYGFFSKDQFVPKTKRAKQYQAVVADYICAGATGRNDLILEWVERFRAEGMTIAVVVGRVEQHAIPLAEMIPGAALLIGAVKHQSPEERKDVKERLEHREIDVVVTTTMEEATNVPSLDVVILAAGGKSQTKLEQRAFRCATRCDEEFRTGFYSKKRGYIVYLRDNADFLSRQGSEVMRVLRKFAKEHPENDLVEVTGPVSEVEIP